MKTSHTTRLLSLLLSLGLSHAATANTGVSDDRVSLPEGPGSLEGVGENVEADPNMGMMSYTIGIQVPQGFAAVTPSLGLSYSSGGGDSIVGIGWSMAMPSIERMTHRRLPKYNTTDDFSANGGEQLIRLPNTNPAIYRARYEKGFVRYTWMDGADGMNGYFKAEMPDGTVGYYGATSAGALVPEARADSAAGTFRYHLVETVDVNGHRLSYTYTKSGTYPLLSSLRYAFNAQGTAVYEVSFTYEERRDGSGVGYISDGQPGFNLLLTQRLSRIEVKSRAVTIRRYLLTYEAYGAAGGFTRLKQVRQQGSDGGTFPVIFDFEYSQALGGICTGSGCTRPFMVSMGTLGVNMGNGTATLIDINGDALPDVVDSALDGPHRFFLNVANLDGTSRFDTTARLSTVGTRSSHNLTASKVQVLDANGDGFTDVINAEGGSFLYNRGTGDWQGVSTDAAASALADLFTTQGTTLRFIDFNNDKRIDVMRSTLTETTFYENQGAAGIRVHTAVPLGVGFDSGTLQLTDMNGDGLLDAVRLQAGGLRYWRNLGWGLFDAPVDITGLPLTDTDIPNAELEDLNGDGLSDLILVKGTSVTYALNNNSAAFNTAVQLDAGDVDGTIPNRDMGITVLYADMNGNGSTDVVWISNSGGAVNFLEMFPVRPNLITRITNAIGQVTNITYGTAAVEMARDGGWGVWRYRLPYPMTVLKRLDHTDLLSNLNDVTEYRYHDGFYDGVEKQFRGFERVEMTTEEEESQEAGHIINTYDVGATDPYRNGLLLSETVASGTRDLRAQTNVYANCSVAEITAGTEFPVLHPCLVETTEITKEGLTQDRWVTTRSATTYDGYGNTTLLVEHGITAVGGGTCGQCTNAPGEYGKPCGTLCLGDEMYTETTFVPPTGTSGAWILNAPMVEKSYAVPMAAMTSEKTTFYDGDAFVGLPAGQLTKGQATRVAARVDAASMETINTARSRYDSHGNVVETMDGLGSLADAYTHRRLYVYDSDHLRVAQVDVLLRDAANTPYSLRREVRYEPLFDKVAEATTWMRLVGGSVAGTRRSTTLAYDEFGRMVRRFYPGNSSASADEEYTYDLRSPASRIITRGRSVRGGVQDVENIQCFDGRARKLQSRIRTANAQYRVDGLTLFNLKSAPLKVFQPYASTSAECDATAPSGVLATTYRYDALDRELEIRTPADAVHGSANISRKVYEPLVTINWSADDTDAQGPHKDTPDTLRRDGLDRLVSSERVLTPGGTPSITELNYDGLGRPISVVDPGGNRKTQVHDLLGRLMRITEPNAGGDSTFEYDASGNVVASTDPRGVITRSNFDGMNRQTALWKDGDESATRITWQFDHDQDCDPSKCTNAEGQQVRVSYPGPRGVPAVEQYGFDIRERTTFMSRSLGGNTFEQTLAYDNQGRLTVVTNPGNRALTRVYDDSGRVTAITGLYSGVVYDARDRLMQFDRSDGTATSYAYDDLMRMTSSRSMLGSTVLQGFGYTRDRIGDILAIADSTSAGVAGPVATTTFTYDAWHRVTEARIGAGATPEVLSFAFDALDNPSSVTSSLGAASPAHKGAYAYDSGVAPNAATQVGNWALGYDAAGNLTSRTDLTMTWDHLGRMTNALKAGLTAQNFYGADQTRVARVEGDSTVYYALPDFEVRDGIATTYVRLDGVVVARVEDTSLAASVLPDRVADGEINAGDVFVSLSGGNAGDAGPQLWSSVRRLLVESGPTDHITQLHNDHLESPTLATGRMEGGTRVLGKRGYYPLGEERGGGVGFVDDLGFTGQILDTSTGLLHFDWRFYDPSLGRWTAIDPGFSRAGPKALGAPGESTSAYGYVGNNFTNARDPTGLWSLRNLFGGNKSKAKAKGSKANKLAKKNNGKGDKGISGPQNGRAHETNIKTISLQEAQAKSKSMDPQIQKIEIENEVNQIESNFAQLESDARLAQDLQNMGDVDDTDLKMNPPNPNDSSARDNAKLPSWESMGMKYYGDSNRNSVSMSSSRGSFARPSVVEVTIKISNNSNANKLADKVKGGQNHK